MRLRPAILFLAIAAGLSHPAQAQYRIDQLSTNDGLPQNTVTGIAQTPDGYLWFATFDGLARFDGVTFTVFDRGSTPVIQRTQFLSLMVDGAGALWAGTDAGALRVLHGEFRWYPPAPGPRPKDPNHPATSIYQPDFVKPTPARWLVASDTLIRSAEPGVAPALHYHLPRSDLSVAGEDDAGSVWLHATDGLVRDSAGHFTTISVADLGGTRMLRVALVDRDGTIWVGTNDRGVLRLRPKVLAAYSVEEGLYARAVYPVIEDGDGHIWMGTSDGVTIWGRGHMSTFVLTRTPGPTFTLKPVPPGGGAALKPSQVHSMSIDQAGRLWISLTDEVLTVEHGRITRSRPLAEDRLEAILATPDGDVWVAGLHGLYRLHGDSLRVYRKDSGFPETMVYALLMDSHGTLWAGTHKGLVRKEGERFTTFTHQDGLAGDIVRSLREDSTGAIWVGTFDAGVSRFKDNRFVTLTTQQGLFSNGVFQMLDDRRGHIWMSSNRGIFRVSARQLDDFADGKIKRVFSIDYGARDGMRTNEANGGRQPAGVRAHDGRLWFPTANGVVVIDPSVARGSRPPAVALSAVEVDGALRAPGDSVVRVAPGESDVAIAFTAPTSVNAGRIQFRYRLRGPDGANEWAEAGTSRSVHYAHLRPGRYTFDVAAASMEGDWSAAPTSLQLIVEPHFWETRWFLGLVLLSLGTMGWSGYALRVRGLKAQEQRLTALVTERTAELSVANAQLKQLAISDALTGLANKRRLEEFLGAEWHRAVRTRMPLSFVLLDVDHFKLYNDSYGHLLGDDCLRRVATVVAASGRSGTDLPSRFGGEEFAVVLSDTDTDGAMVMGEKIRAGVEALATEHKASKTARVVTVSVGVATADPAQGESTEQLVAAADRALYAAKEHGRNRVEAATPQPVGT